MNGNETLPVEMTIAARWDWIAHVAKAMLQNHHGELLTSLKPHIPTDGVVIDVGAHSGQTAKIFARLASNGKVYAFEPGSYALSVLRPAIWASRLSNIEIIPMGLSDEPGTATLSMPVKNHGGYGFGLSHMATPDDSRPTVEETITISTLDKFVSDRALDRIDFIKADIEGWELAFLKGASATIGKFKPVFMLEIAENSLERANASPSDLFQLLGAHGYAAMKLESGEAAPNFDGDADYIFAPPH